MIARAVILMGEAPIVRQSARVRRVAALLDIDESQVRRMVASGDLEAHRTGKRGIRVYLDSVEHWQQTHRVAPAQSAGVVPAGAPRPVSPATRAAHRHAVASLRRAGFL